jgi:sugar (pentulose or hexulose) kinase
MEKNELENADAFLMLPDLIGFFLTGEKSSEYVATSTSSLLDVSTGDWSEPVLATLPFSRSIFKNIVGPGTHCGPINDPELETFRDKNIGLIKTAGHDSGSAVVSIPLTKADAIYVSSGSWSLIGVEAAKPVTTGEAYRYGFSNQGLPEGNFRVQRAIPGLWIIQQCLKEWQVSQAGLTFAGVEKMADDHSGFPAYVDVEQPAFSQPGNMTEKIREYCRVTGQKVPESAGEIASCIYSSLALKYKTAAAQLDSLFGHVFTNIYIVGGGARDAGLAARVASAASKTVLTGLYDASAMGNGLVQLIAHGHIRDISQAREIVSNSYALSRFEPGDAEPWNFALAHARQIEETYKSRVPDSLPQV